MRPGLGPDTRVAVSLRCRGGALLGFVIGSLAIRRQGIYFADGNAGLHRWSISPQFRPTLPRRRRHPGVPRWGPVRLFSLSDNLAPLFPFVLAVTFGGICCLYRIVHSTLWPSAQGDPRKTNPGQFSLGYNVNAYKLIRSPCPRPMAGVAQATKSQCVPSWSSLTDVHCPISQARSFLMTLLGGMGTIFGLVCLQRP